jgi:hypothetical protein
MIVLNGSWMEAGRLEVEECVVDGCIALCF